MSTSPDPDPDPDPYSKWTSLPSSDLTTKNIQELLEPLEDDLWVAVACAERVGDVEDLGVGLGLVGLGVGRTEEGARRVWEVLGEGKEEEEGKEGAQREEEEKEGGEGGEEGGGGKEGEGDVEALRRYFEMHRGVARLCQVRAALVRRRERLETYERVAKVMAASGDLGGKEDWEDDPWGDDGGDIDDNDDNDIDDDNDSNDENAKAGPSTPPTSTIPKEAHSHLPLSFFLTEPISTSCLLLAAQSQFKALQVIRSRHKREYARVRVRVLEGIPGFVDPAEYRELLLGVDLGRGVERVELGDGEGEGEGEVVLERVVVEALRRCEFLREEALGSLGGTEEEEGEEDEIRALTSDEVLRWYKDRIDRILLETGIADNALSLVQHGIAHGVLGLDAVGEDLSLISRLVYDAPRPRHGRGRDTFENTSIGVSKWETLGPGEIVGLYLEYSTPDTIVSDIRRLVKPYLFVLESRCERAGKPDPGLGKRLLHEYILNASLDLVAPIFDSSKPTMVAAQRLITNDEDLARLALACLYGSDSTDDWTSMSRIFECLPAWNFQTTEDEDEADTTISSLSAFLVPTTAHPHTAPKDLIAFFKPLPARSLSRALDILDVHLESGEMLSRWGVPVPLRWFLRSSRDVAQQRAWAARMARQADAPKGDLESEDVWLSLLEDMLKLSKPDPEGEDTNSAFGALAGDEIRKIFFKGVLSTGRFEIAKSIALPRHGERLLPSSIIEALCIEVSHEFYDNADSGNFNFGNMKLAYNCLSVAPQTPLIARERDFIEATSRISSFNVPSLTSGLPLLPIEIRLTKDKLSLLQRILSSNKSAYRHAEVLLELMALLGYREDPVAEVKVMGMVAGCAREAGDEGRALAACERCVGAALRVRARKGEREEGVGEAMEVCWRELFEVVKRFEVGGEDGIPGNGTGTGELDRKTTLIARALEFCPPDQIPSILPLYTSLEKYQLSNRAALLSSRHNSSPSTSAARKRERAGASLTSRLHDSLAHVTSPSLPLPSASSIASSTFTRVAAALPFSTHNQPHNPNRSQSPLSASVSTHSQQQYPYSPLQPWSANGTSTSRSPSTYSDTRQSHLHIGGGEFERDDQDWDSRSGFSGRSPSRSRSPGLGGDVSSQASKALRRGVGWLIGADEDEI